MFTKHQNNGLMDSTQSGSRYGTLMVDAIVKLSKFRSVKSAKTQPLTALHIQHGLASAVYPTTFRSAKEWQDYQYTKKKSSIFP